MVALGDSMAVCSNLHIHVLTGDNRPKAQSEIDQYVNEPDNYLVEFETC